jgi:hypothetical protein
LIETSFVFVCELDADSEPDAEWGGFYFRNESTTVCVHENRLTSPDVCGCEPGTAVNGELYLAKNVDGERIRIPFCRTTGNPVGAHPFVGAFSQCGGMCIGGSGSCSCPPGSFAQTFSTLNRAGTGIAGGGECEGTSTICYAM